MVEIEKMENVFPYGNEEWFKNAKVLLIGYGYWGQIWYKTLMKAKVLAGVVDAIFEKQLSQPGEHGIAYTNLDGKIGCSGTTCLREFGDFTHVIIATPANTHLSIYRELKEKFNLDDNKILVEKPVGTSYEEANQMRFCHHGFVWLYDEMYEIFKERKNSLGKLLSYKTIRASMGPRIRTDISILEDYLFHDLYLYFDVFDVSAQDIPRVNSVEYDRYFNEPIKASGINLKLDSYFFPMQIEMFSSWWHPKKERKITLIGSMGSLIWENDNIFINRSHYEKREVDFTDKHQNKGYELLLYPLLEMNNKSEKTNLEKQLDNFINSNESNTTQLLMRTWTLIKLINATYEGKFK
jgi:predicted dehydrogenase